MRTVPLIAAGLVALVAATDPGQAQYYRYPVYGPYYVYPYGYYPPPYYYPPPPVIYAPTPFYRPAPVIRRYVARHAVRRLTRAPAYRRPPRPLVNPLLGPLPGPTRRR